MTAYTRWHIESRQKDGYYFDSAWLQASGGGALRPRGTEEEDGMPFEGRRRATQQQQFGLWTGKPVLVHSLLAGWRRLAWLCQSRHGARSDRLFACCADVACAWMRRSWFRVTRLNFPFSINKSHRISC